MPGSARLTRRFVDRALKDHSTWDLGNEVLYELCRKHPEHHDEAEIVGKLWLIGRTYAASIERRRKNVSEVSGDDFYTEVVAPQIRSARIDRWLRPLRTLAGPDAECVVPAHARLTRLFRDISGSGKRSLASKYLHFHFPRAVYIYDERVSRGIREVSPPLRLRHLPFRESDDTYARFFLRCQQLHDELEQMMGRRMAPREVDKVLLAVADGG